MCWFVGSHPTWLLAALGVLFAALVIGGTASAVEVRVQVRPPNEPGDVAYVENGTDLIIYPTQFTADASAAFRIVSLSEGDVLGDTGPMTPSDPQRSFLYRGENCSALVSRVAAEAFWVNTIVPQAATDVNLARANEVSITDEIRSQRFSRGTDLVIHLISLAPDDSARIRIDEQTPESRQVILSDLGAMRESDSRLFDYRGSRFRATLTNVETQKILVAIENARDPNPPAASPLGRASEPASGLESPLPQRGDGQEQAGEPEQADEPEPEQPEMRSKSLKLRILEMLESIENPRSLLRGSPSPPCSSSSRSRCSWWFGFRGDSANCLMSGTTVCTSMP